MRAERAKREPEFVPVIVTLESQEEVDALFIVCNHPYITNVLPALRGWWSKLVPYRTKDHRLLYAKLNDILR